MDGSIVDIVHETKLLAEDPLGGPPKKPRPSTTLARAPLALAILGWGGAILMPFVCSAIGEWTGVVLMLSTLLIVGPIIVFAGVVVTIVAFVKGVRSGAFWVGAVLVVLLAIPCTLFLVTYWRLV
jgi:hypothetical protein